MKNKKGFTLIELLIVVALLGIIGVIVTVNVINILNKTEENECADYIASIESNACLFISTKDGEKKCTRNEDCTITLNDLVVNGYIEESFNKCSKKNMSLDDTISIEWDENGEKKCEYSNK